MSQLFQRKPIAALVDDAHGPGLKRVMGAGDLIMLAIGAVIGAGIFSSIGTAAAGEMLPTGEVVRYCHLSGAFRSPGLPRAFTS